VDDSHARNRVESADSEVLDQPWLGVCWTSTTAAATAYGRAYRRRLERSVGAWLRCGRLRAAAGSVVAAPARPSAARVAIEGGVPDGFTVLGGAFVSRNLQRRRLPLWRGRCWPPWLKHHRFEAHYLDGWSVAWPRRKALL